MDQADRTAVEGLTHASLMRRYRWPMLGTLAMLLVENGGQITIPYMLGVAIDGLIVGTLHGWSLFLAVSAILLCVAVARRVYDTRLYARINREVGEELAIRESAGGAGIAQTTARVNFVKDFSTFFEIMLPAALTSAFMLVGSVVMLALISPTLGLATFVVAALIGTIFVSSRGRIRSLNARVNDEMESQVDRLSGPAEERSAHFHALAAWRIKLSDLEARNFGLLQFFAICLLGGALVQLLWYERSTEGQVFAAMTYLIQFTQAAIVLPYTYQEYLRTSEISERLSQADAERPEDGARRSAESEAARDGPDA